MTREEFMEHAREVIHDTMTKRENRLMTLVEEAYGQGRKHEESKKIAEVVREAVQLLTESDFKIPDPEELVIDEGDEER